MKTIISSQRYIDYNIVDEKIKYLQDNAITEITLYTWDVIDYDCAILFNGHHTLQAARELNMPVKFEIINHPENIFGDNLLEQAWMDSDWYSVETGKLFF